MPTTTAADKLIETYPSAAEQLRGPVLTYLSPYMPFPSEQSLYLAVFYPAARDWAIGRAFPQNVRDENPGIVTVSDYVTKARAYGLRYTAGDDSAEALHTTALELQVPDDWLSNLIAIESQWNPLARNPYSGARGLIQFMPATAEALMYRPPGGILPVVAVILGAALLSRLT